MNQNQDNVNQKLNALNNAKYSAEGLLLDNPEQHPVSYNTSVRLSIPGTTGFNLDLGPFEIRNREELNRLLNQGGVAFDPFPEGINPAENPGDGYAVAQAIQKKTIEEYNNLRQRIIDRRNEINTAQQNLDQALREKSNADNTLNSARQTLNSISDEKDTLLKASELISDMGEKIGSHLGDKYKAVAKEIAEDIKNFQGKSIRSYDQAMTSLNKITSNPAVKINQADKEALVNAWRSLNAGDMANKLSNLSRAFKVADVVMKIEKVREKSIIGYETGNWGPLMLEVESWVLSGLAAGAAMALFSAILGAFTLPALALTALTILGIMGISYLASYIDDKIANQINNEVARFFN